MNYVYINRDIRDRLKYNNVHLEKVGFAELFEMLQYADKITELNRDTLLYRQCLKRCLPRKHFAVSYNFFKEYIYGDDLVNGDESIYDASEVYENSTDEARLLMQSHKNTRIIINKDLDAFIYYDEDYHTNMLPHKQVMCNLKHVTANDMLGDNIFKHYINCLREANM